MTDIHLQAALDLTELSRALVIAQEAVSGGADWIEVGTPLIKSEGMNAVRAVKSRFKDKVVVADMKVADTGALEVEMAAKAGADVVCILASSDDSVIAEAVKAGRLYGVKIAADLLSVPEPEKRAVEMEKAGVDILIAHTGIDQQMRGCDPLLLLRKTAGLVGIPVCAAGGINADNAGDAVAAGASVVIVGSAITKSADVKAAAEKIISAMNKGAGKCGNSATEIQNTDDEIRKILMQVSAPNVTDAMFRKGAMKNILSLCGNVKAVGKAVTVETNAGDWAKAVEAIDAAEPGDVIVINNGHDTTVSPWGELATWSCAVKKIAGVVIDGSARDIDGIKETGVPVFARGVCPNAGEPKGFGEIGSEIYCCGQYVRPGDWIIGDESGVVVIPREHAYETARRALEIHKNENRVREEIKRGGTLASLLELKKWEKKQA